MTKFLAHPYVFRGIIALYIAALFALVASYFAVSTMDIDVALYLQAPSKLVAGKPTAARGIVLNAPTGNLFVGARTDFQIGSVDVGSAKTESHGHLHARIEPAATLVGRQTMRIAVSHPAVEAFTVDADVEVVSDGGSVKWPEATTRRSEGTSNHEEEWEGELRVRVLPTNGEIPRGLPTVAYLLLTDKEGRPVTGTIMLDKVEGMLAKEIPKGYRTDQLGLAKLDLEAATSLKLTVSATAPAKDKPEARTGKGAVRIHTVPSQFSMRPTQLLAVPGQPVEAIVHSLHRSGGLLVDLYENERWAYADAFGIAPDQSGVRAIVPDDVSADLVRLQVYMDLFDPGSAWDSRWLARASTQAPDECPAAVERVLRQLAAKDAALQGWATAVLESGDVTDPLRAAGRCNLWLEAALLGVPQHFQPSPLLVNSQKDDRDDLDVWRKKMQAQLIVATAGALLAGFLFVLLLVLQGMQRAQEQARLIREVELETSTAEELARVPEFDVEKWLVVLRTIIIIASIFTFGASLLMLLSWM